MVRDRQLTIAAVEAGPNVEGPELLSILDSTDSAQEFRDRSTGLTLTSEMVKMAREREMQYMDVLKVLEESDQGIDDTGRSTSTRATRSGPTTGAGWSAKRCACGQQLMFRIGQRRLPRLPLTRLFRLQVSWLMTGPRSEAQGDDEVLMLLDSSRAHLLSPLLRVVCVTINGNVYKLLEAMYELRDAGHHSTENCLM